MKRKISKLLAATALMGALGISVVACGNNDSTSKTKQSLSLIHISEPTRPY